MSSHSGGRSPKDLRHLLSVAREEDSFFPEDVQLNLGKLKSLSKDELSENAMLRSRIEQQSELICILKKQADSSLTKSLALEKDMKELQNAKEEAECNYHEEKRKYHVLEKRFDVLFYNHEEIIKFKDEYKRENDQLRKQNSEFMSIKEEDEAVLIQEKDTAIKNLKEKLAILEQKFEESKEELRNVKEQSTLCEKQSCELVEKLKLQINSAGKKSQEMEEKHTSLSLQLRSSEQEIKRLKGEKEIYTQMASNRKQTECDNQQTIRGLLEKVKELEISIRTQAEKFRKDFENASANAQVRKLSTALEIAEDKIKNHDKEFAAYKTHTDKLLLKERELNTKLRQLIG